MLRVFGPKEKIVFTYQHANWIDFILGAMPIGVMLRWNEDKVPGDTGY